MMMAAGGLNDNLPDFFNGKGTSGDQEFSRWVFVSGFITACRQSCPESGCWKLHMKRVLTAVVLVLLYIGRYRKRQHSGGVAVT